MNTSLFSLIFLMKLPAITVWLFLSLQIEYQEMSMMYLRYFGSGQVQQRQNFSDCSKVYRVNRDEWTARPYVQRLKHTRYQSEWIHEFFSIIIDMTWGHLVPTLTPACLPPNTPAMDMWASELDRRAKVARSEEKPFLLSVCAVLNWGMYGTGMLHGKHAGRWSQRDGFWHVLRGEN